MANTLAANKTAAAPETNAAVKRLAVFAAAAGLPTWAIDMAACACSAWASS